MRRVKAVQTVLTVVALCTLTLVVLLLLPPVIRKVNQKRDSTLDMFLTIPPSRVQEIAASKEEMLVQMGLTAEASGTFALIAPICRTDFRIEIFLHLCDWTDLFAVFLIQTESRLMLSRQKLTAAIETALAVRELQNKVRVRPL